MEYFMMEEENIKLVTLPVDGNTAAITGSRVAVAGYERVSFVVQMGDSAGATTAFTLRQHNAASAGTSKDLSVANSYYHKKAALTVFTKVEPSSAAAAYDLSTIFAADEGIVVFEVLAEDLDVNNDFAWVSLDIADMAAAKLVSVIAICSGGAKPAYATAL